MATSNPILLRGRLSFPQLVEPKAFNPGDVAKYSATVLMDIEKDRESIVNLKKEIKKFSLEHFGEELPADRVCLQRGDKPNKLKYEGYGENIRFIAASNRNPVVLVDSTGKNIPPQKFVGGYEVTLSITLWDQKKTGKQGGNRVNCNLIGVMLRNDDPELSFSEAAVSKTAAFPGLVDSDDSAESDVDEDDI